MENTTEEKVIERERTQSQKVLETGFCVLIWTALGLFLEIFGPNLIDLKIKLNANYEEITSSIAGRSVGIFPGSILGGILVDRFGGHYHLVIASSLFVASVVTVPIPWLPNVDYLWIVCFIEGVTDAILNVAGQKLILKIWKDNSASSLFLLHTGYGMGALMVPLFSNPFLAVKAPDKPTEGMNASSTIYPDVKNTSVYLWESEHEEYLKESRIQYSFVIAAVPVALLSFVFFAYQIRENRIMQNGLPINSTEPSESSKLSPDTDNHSRLRRTFREMIDPASCAGGRRWYGIQLLILLFFFIANTSGGEKMINGFLRTFTIDQMKFDQDTASVLNMTFWISCTVGRFLFFLAAKWISVRKLILIETGMLLAVSFLMNVLASDSSAAYWVLVQLLGMFFAPMWPCCISWIDNHMELTGIGLMIIMLGGSIGGIGHLKLIGYLYEHKGPMTYLYQILALSVLELTLAIILDLVGSQHGSRFSKHKVKDEEKNKDDQTPEESIAIKKVFVELQCPSDV